MAGRPIELLELGQVSEISLDHDLIDDERGTGYDVILWLGDAVAARGFKASEIKVHSANTWARKKMLSGIASIERHQKIMASHETTAYAVDSWLTLAQMKKGLHLCKPLILLVPTAGFELAT